MSTGMQTGVTFNGRSREDNSGFSVSSAGDINADGIDDLIIGAPYADTNARNSGATHVVFGRSDGFGPIFDLSSLDGGNGFTINGKAQFDASGSTVSGAGDINADGIDDLIIGARDADLPVFRGGESYVVFGRSDGFAATLELSALNGANGFAVNANKRADRSGVSVSGAGDVDADGIDDLIIGAHYADPNGPSSGESYVVLGRSDGFEASIAPSDLNGATGFTIHGKSARDYSGVSVSGAGDVNGDGIDDLIIGADGADPNGSSSGESYVVFGRSDGFGATLELADLDGAMGFAIKGKRADAYSGLSVSGAGDINGDGLADLLVGAYGAAPNGVDSGETHVVFGRSDGFAASLDLSALNGTNGFTINGKKKADYSGFSVSGAGDINGDGLDDIIIGARLADTNGKKNGESYVVFGRSDGFGATLELSALDGANGYAFQGERALDQSGHSVSGAGDINGDGIDDLIIGARRASPNGYASGESYVVFGGDDGLRALDRLSGATDGTINLRKLGIVFGSDDRDTIAGTGEDDRIVGFSGADSLVGQNGDDILRGQRGNDILNGGEGNDTLIGARGKNTLFGGAGADVFVMRVLDRKRDVIRDFEDGRDVIDLSKLKLDFSDIGVFDDGPGKVRIEISGDVLIVRDDGAGLLSGVDIDVNDFLF